jgi:hypothetical protein
MIVGLISNQQTFIDLTDSTPLEMSIACNLPTVQIKDNSAVPVTYSPSWETNNLVLTPSVFLNSAASVIFTKYVWTRQDGAAAPVPLIAGESVNSTTGVLTVRTNNLSTSSSGVITYICTATTKDNRTATEKISFSLITSGTTSTSDNASVTFQLYAPNGYILSNSIESLTLQTSAYVGSTQIQFGEATYNWYAQNDTEWELVQEGTSSSYVVTRDYVSQFKNFKCDMLYKGNTYTSTILVEDKSDIYNAIICVSSNINTITGQYYWIVYTLVYNQYGELDPLLGPVSVSAPVNPALNDYWYSIDSDKQIIMLKKYNGTEWVDSVDTQSLSYYWSMVSGSHDDMPMGESSKVVLISSTDFTTSATFKCDISTVSDGLLAMATLSLTDTSDPIISSTAPTGVDDGQIWIKKNTDGTYIMFIWDAMAETWITADADSKNQIYTSRPSKYNVGDLWITNSDNDHDSYLQGTLLQAQTSNTKYDSLDWEPTLKYDSTLEELQGKLDNLSQYVRINSEGLQIGAKTANGEISPFTSLFTSTELSFYQNSDKLLTLTNNKLIAPKIEVEDSLTVDGSIRLGDMRWVIESNGSYSFSVFK